MAASRSAFRITSSPLTRTTFRPSAFKQPLLRQTRQQTTAAADAAPAQAAPTGFARFWNSPIGPKTVHFWAPVAKWSLALAGVADFTRPANQLSLSQNSALIATGLIWTRWCFIIKPRNLALAAVNFFLFMVGTTQVTRIMLWRQSQKEDSLVDEAKDVARDAATTTEGIVEDPKGAVKQAGKV